MATIGPCVINTYGAKAWSKMNLPKGTKLADVWKLCGPMVERNLTNRPIWEVFCMVYLEALQHGSAVSAHVGLFKDAQGKDFPAESP